MSEMRIAVALGSTALTGWAERGVADPCRVEMDGAPGTLPSEEVLAGAFGQLRLLLERSLDRDLDGSSVTVALLPPLAQLREVDLPPLSDDEAEALLQRDGSRYFPGGALQRVVSVIPRDGKDDPVRAVAASALLLESILGAARGAGFRVGGMVAAQSAWAAALHGSAGLVVVAEEHQVHLLEVRRGRTVGVRRAPLTADGGWRDLVIGSELAGSESTGTGATLLGSAEALGIVRAGLAGSGIQLRTPDAGADPERMAARGAFTAVPRLIPPGLAAERRSRSATLGRRLVGIGMVLLIAGVVLHNLGLRRELATLQGARSELRVEVAPLLDARDSLVALNDEVRALREVARRSHHWAAAISEVALLLPRESWLTSLSGSEGMLEFEASGARAGVALDALREARTLSGARLDGLVERELEDGATVVERFRLGARVAGGGSASPSPTEGNR